MLEEHPGVSPSPFSSLFLFMWGQTQSLTSSLPFPLTKAPHYYVCWFVYSAIKRQEVAVAMPFMYKQVAVVVNWIERRAEVNLISAQAALGFVINIDADGCICLLYPSSNTDGVLSYDATQPVSKQECPRFRRNLSASCEARNQRPL